MCVVLNTTLNTGHFHGLAEETYVLPVLARDEEPAPTTQESMFNFVRLSDGGPRRLQGPRSEISLIAAFGSKVKETSTKVDWRSMRNPEEIRRWIASVVPGYSSIAEIGKSKEEFHIAGRTLHRPDLATDSGKARLHCHSS